MFKFVREILSQDNELSSKRVCGLISYFTCLILIVYCVISTGLTDYTKDLINSVFYTSSVLLGFGSIEKLVKK